MKQTTLRLDDEQSARPVLPLEEQQKQALIELMAQAIAALARPSQGEHDEPA